MYQCKERLSGRTQKVANYISQQYISINVDLYLILVLFFSAPPRDRTGNAGIINHVNTYVILNMVLLTVYAYLG